MDASICILFSCIEACAVVMVTSINKCTCTNTMVDKRLSGMSFFITFICTAITDSQFGVACMIMHALIYMCLLS